MKTGQVPFTAGSASHELDAVQKTSSKQRHRSGLNLLDETGGEEASHRHLIQPERRISSSTKTIKRGETTRPPEQEPFERRRLHRDSSARSSRSDESDCWSSTVRASNRTTEAGILRLPRDDALRRLHRDVSARTSKSDEPAPRRRKENMQLARKTASSSCPAIIPGEDNREHSAVVEMDELDFMLAQARIRRSQRGKQNPMAAERAYKKEKSSKPPRYLGMKPPSDADGIIKDNQHPLPARKVDIKPPLLDADGLVREQEPLVRKGRKTPPEDADGIIKEIHLSVRRGTSNSPERAWSEQTAFV